MRKHTTVKVAVRDIHINLTFDHCNYFFSQKLGMQKLYSIWVQ